MQESWKQIPGFDGYEVSDLGRVRSFWIMGCRARIGDIPRIMHLTLNRRDNRFKVNLRFAPKKWRTRFVHRLVWLAFCGETPEGLELDHIDNNSLNDALTNLRVVTRSQNQANCRGRGNKRSKYKGVRPNGERWSAVIKFQYQNIYLGTFDTEEEAACAYNGKALELFGDYSKLNVIESR